MVTFEDENFDANIKAQSTHFAYLHVKTAVDY
jgi:hypothetical protein